MNVFVTVGTTPFNELIKSVDEVSYNFDSWSFTYQISEGDYFPKNGKSFKFVQNIDCFYKNADIVITHAGAGSIYRLLELRKKIIVVPNLVRVDKHQIDIANFMEKNEHALVLSDFKNTFNTIKSIENFTPNLYVKDDFFVKDEIVNFILEAIK